MRDSRLKWGLIFLFVLWLFYGLSAYYVVQKPFSVPQLVALLENPAAWLTLDFAGRRSGARCWMWVRPFSSTSPPGELAHNYLVTQN